MATQAERITKARQKIQLLKKQVKEARISKTADFSGIKSILEKPLPALCPKLSARKTLKGHFHKIYAIHWSASKPNEMISAGQDGKLILWDTLTGLKKQVVPLRSAWVMTCAIEPTRGNLVACGGLDNLCSIYKVNEEDAPFVVRVHRELAAHDGYMSCCRFIDERNIVTSSGDRTCMLWDVERAQCLSTFADHEGDVMALSILPDVDPNVFVSGSCDNCAKVWDVRTGQCTMTLRGHESDINSICFFPDGKSFATGSDDATCRVFDIRSCAEVSSFSSDQVVCGVTSVSCSHSGRVLFAGYDDYNCLGWDVLGDQGDKHCFQLQGHENRVSCLGVSADGHALCTASWDSTLKIWA
jgi:guanine nucleotide-binding protein G(I)/G(S)/G(T) subunit beta-1